MTCRLPVAAAAVALLISSPSALAATATVTDDGGNPIPADGATIRNMSPSVGVQFTAAEYRYSLVVLGPGGAVVSRQVTCLRSAFGSPERVAYQGNGTYTAVVRTYRESDTSCQTPAESRHAFTINAYVNIGAPAPVLLMRPAGSYSSIAHPFPVDANPGAGTHEIHYAAGAAIGADGGISGPTQSAFLSSSGPFAEVRFTTPGRYTFVARAKSFSGSAGDHPTPWSPPVTVTVLAPFDLSLTSFPDSRGPSYQLRGHIREKTATGRVIVSIAKGHKGGSFRRLGRARIRRDATFQLRFRQSRPGRYRLRYAYEGGPTVAPGAAVEKIRIKRRTFFR